MTYELLIAEKPIAAKKIAEALSDDTVKKHANKKVPYYELTHNNKKIIVGCAVGHLFGLKEKDGKGWTYPFFSYEWKPSYEVNKAAKYTKDYIDTLKKLAKDANDFTVCTDFDEEGSLIGEKIVELICNKKDAHRMKFSSLTKSELVKSYENKMKKLDWPQIKAGETRHNLDFLWGLNTSRALTLAVKTTGSFKILSAGRVQGPALKILTDLENEITAFKPEPYWELHLTGNIEKNNIAAIHQDGKIFDKKKAELIFKKTLGKPASVAKINTSVIKHLPPHPFDLTSLQLEAFKVFGITPKETLTLTQNLYTASLITYPRTSSQEIPDSTDSKELLTQLAKQQKYSTLCTELLKKSKLIPHNGKKKDPAHPAVIPTGEFPKDMPDREMKMYDLIVRRTLATFSDPSLRETLELEINCNDEIFLSRGTKTKVEGWQKFYGPLLKLQEQEFPQVKEGMHLESPKVTKEDKETQPPRRYSQASIVKELEKRNLGTKTTRALIVDTLYDRDYVEDKSIKVTELGKAITKTLEKYVPELISEELTREFEKDMALIKKEKKEPEEIVQEAAKLLKKIFTNFKNKEKEIGQGLIEAIKETRDKATLIGECRVCKKGTLKIMYSRRFKSFFVACNAYPNCKTTYSVPKFALPKPTDKTCESCGFPLVKMMRKQRGPYDFCINKSCPKKEAWLKEQQAKATAATQKV